MALTSLTITYKGDNIWTLTDNEGNVRSEAYYSGGVWNEYMVFKSKTGGNIYNLVPYDIINYVDEITPANNFTPTSAIQLLTYLKEVDFFATSIGGGGGVDTLLQLLDVTTPTYLGKAFWVLTVNEDEQTVSFKQVTGLVQDNKAITKYLVMIGAVTPSNIASAINNGAQFEVTETQELWVDAQHGLTIQEGVDNQTPTVSKYKVMNKGKGIYGLGGTVTVLAKDLKYLGTYGATIEDIEDDPNTDIVSYDPQTSPDTVSTWLNEQAIPIEIQPQDEGYTLFKGTVDSIQRDYLFVGTAGLYGVGELQSTMDDFQLLESDTPVTIIPNAQQVMDAGNESTTPFVAKNDVTDEKVQYDSEGIKHQKNDITTSVGFEPNTDFTQWKHPSKNGGLHHYASEGWVWSRIYTVDVEYFGAVGDGVTDDADAIQDALNSNFSHIIIGKDPNSIYVVSRTIFIPSNKTVIINGTVIMQDGHEDLLLADVPIGATTVPVTDAHLKYFAGQQICISSTVMTTQGGQTGQTRKWAEAFYVTEVSGDTITLSNPTHYAFNTANSAKIGHCQSVFVVQGTIAENKTKINVIGFGVVDQNKANQYDVEPVSYSLVDGSSQFSEDVRYGCGISVNYANDVYIGDGLTVQNTVLHGVQFFECENIDHNRCTVDGAHDKGLLIWFTSDFRVTNSRFLNSDYEDGIYLHNDARGGTISNVYAENCNRSGFSIGTNSSEIIINNAETKDCGQAGRFISSSHCSVRNFKSSGGGRDRYTIGGILTNRAMFTIQSMVDSDFDLQVTDSELATAGITIVGATTNISLKAHIADLLSSESDGTGIVIGFAGFYPSNIFIHDSFILRNKLGLRLDEGCTNIRIANSRVVDNTITVTNNIGTEFKSFNTEGITDSYIEGNLEVTGNVSGQDATEPNHYVTLQQLPPVTTENYHQTLTAGNTSGLTAIHSNITSPGNEDKSEISPENVIVEKITSGVSEKVTIEHDRIIYTDNDKTINILMPSSLSSTVYNIQYPSRPGVFVNKIGNKQADVYGTLHLERAITTVTEAVSYSIDKELDKDKILLFENGCDVVLPQADGFPYEFIGVQMGTGKLNFVPQESEGTPLITILNPAGTNAATAGQYSVFKIKYIDTLSAVLYGDLETDEVLTEYPETTLPDTDVTWTGTTAPSGTWVGNWQATKTGKKVSARFNGWYTTPGAGLTGVTIAFPAGLPTPASITGFTGSTDYVLPGQGYIINSPSGGPSAFFPRVSLKKNASAYEIVLNTSSTGFSGFYLIIEYWTA